MKKNIQIAKELISHADAVLITAGAGMSVDSGLPDLRSSEDFWRVYPPLKEMNLDFESIANPYCFETNPSVAWAFYGHRLNLYRNTTPHDGFKFLLDLVKEKNENYFVYTSNVDGQFQKAGFDPQKIVEIYGSIHHTQCCNNHNTTIRADKINIKIDESQFKAITIPLCQKCGSALRPNILMFADFGWDMSRLIRQEKRHIRWLKELTFNNKKLVIIEIGAWEYVPTIRLKSHLVAKKLKASVIRINPIDFEISESIGVGLEASAASGLQEVLQE